MRQRRSQARRKKGSHEEQKEPRNQQGETEEQLPVLLRKPTTQGKDARVVVGMGNARGRLQSARSADYEGKSIKQDWTNSMSIGDEIAEQIFQECVKGVRIGGQAGFDQARAARIIQEEISRAWKVGQLNEKMTKEIESLELLRREARLWREAFDLVYPRDDLRMWADRRYEELLEAKTVKETLK